MMYFWRRRAIFRLHMKQFLRKIVLWILTACARVRLARMRRYGVKIIGITGSIGKTTCKEAIAHVLRGGHVGTRAASEGMYRVLSSEKSYNTEFGLPLTILELKSEFSSVMGWVKNLILAIWKSMFSRADYDFLILEMGVDKPGDMDLLLEVLGYGIEKMGTGAPEGTPPLRYGVVTGVHPVHMADGQFADMDAIFHEKAKLVSGVRADGVVLLNYDDARCRNLAGEMKKNVSGPKIITYGSEGAKLRVSQAQSGWDGIDFISTYGEVSGSFHVPILGKQHIGSLLPAIGCGLMAGMYMRDIAEQMKTFVLPPGRLSLIEGLSGSRIIDSSYNASPDAVRAAVDTMYELGEEHSAPLRVRKRIFVMGNMNELGAGSEKEHREIAAYVKGKIDMLVTVGDMARLVAEEVREMEVASFDDALAAAEYLKPRLKEGDIVLVKGSQNKVRLERLVKAIMKDPSQARSQLARQDWVDA